MVRIDVEESYRHFKHSSKEFVYFHKRKWAVKYLTNFLNCALVYKKDNPKTNE